MPKTISHHNLLTHISLELKAQHRRRDEWTPKVLISSETYTYLREFLRDNRPHPQIYRVEDYFNHINPSFFDEEVIYTDTYTGLLWELD